MTDARRPASNPLVIPSLAGGLFALVATLTIRVPLHAVVVAALAIGVIVLGHLALARSTGNRRIVAAVGLVAGYIALIIALGSVVTMALA